MSLRQLPPPALQPDTFALTALLAFLTSFGPISVDLYLPSMPDVGRAFGESEARVQLTISLYLIGYAIGQVMYGPISDRFGRKPVILAVLLLYCAGGVICLTASTLEMLIAGRVAQAFGASGALIVTRAVVRDLYEGPRAGHQLSAMGTMMGLAPIVAPIVGGVLLTLSGWRAGFAFQLGVGAVAAALVWRYLAETHVPSVTRLAAIMANYRAIALNPVFLAHAAIGSLAYSGLFAWIGGSPFILQQLAGLSPLGFAICYAVSCAGYVVGSGIATRIVLRVGLDRTTGLGALALAVAGAASLASAAAGVALPLTLTASMALFLCGMGLVLPQVMAGALTPFPRSAGTASSLLGFAQLCAGAAMSIIVGSTLGQSAWPMAVGVAVAGFGSLLLWATTRGLRTRTSKE